VPTRFHYRPRFLLKAVLALGLIIAADQLFFWQAIGSTIGAFMFAVVLAVVATNRHVIVDRRARMALAVAVSLALILFENPTFLGTMLVAGGLWIAVLIPRLNRFDDGARWLARIGLAIFLAFERPVHDLVTILGRSKRRGFSGHGIALHIVILPIVGSAVFILLFALANPLIGRFFTELDPVIWFTGFSPYRVFFWGVTGVLIWSWLRPTVLARLSSRSRTRIHQPESRNQRATITLSLAAFNLVFALQNGLDIIFLWSGAALPEGVTLAEYAHQGAYPLIVTALLAGMFVLAALQPGSGLESNKRVRLLVYVWVAQNILLVASSILRTLDYVDVYSLTQLRLAALIWMVLVGIGLALICLRIIVKRSGAWLINANCIAALIALIGCSVVDLAEVTARWNLAHNIDVTGKGVLLDRDYLVELGASALVPLSEALADQPPNPAYAQELRTVRDRIRHSLVLQQADWHGWTWRNARRLAQSDPLTAETNP
jgi:hypothetical protein